MKRILLPLAAIFSGGFTFITTSASAANDLTPYQSVVLASSYNYCAAEYGLVSQKQAYKMIIDWVTEDHGIKPYQVYNLMQRKSFGDDTDKLIKRAGGCKTIASDIQKRLEEKSSGISGVFTNKKDYEYFYNLGD